MSCEQNVDLRPRAPESWRTAVPALSRARALARTDELAIEAGRLLEDVRTALDNDLGAALRAAGKLAALLGCNRRDVPGGVPAHGGLAPWQMRRVRDHIARHLETSIPVEDLAKLVSLSAGHFCRAFKESFGDTPHAYIMRARLERAQELMLTSPEPLGQIALACGHSDQAHFSRRFRQQMGETPNAWRRRHAGDDWATSNRETNSPARAALSGGLAWAATAG
jgi:AraC family transcriptional regulator